MVSHVIIYTCSCLYSMYSTENKIKQHIFTGALCTGGGVMSLPWLHFKP